MARFTLKLVVFAAGVTGAGCVHHDHRGYDTAIRSAVDHPLKPPVRSQVHLFVLNGYNPTEDAELARMRDCVVRAGFPMVHLAQRADADFFYREMYRLTVDQPPARFILVAYGGAAGPARELACKVAGDGLPLDALVLLDPAGGRTELIVEDHVPVTIVRSHNWPLGRNLPPADVTELVGIGHLSLPSHVQTVEILAGLLANSAARVQLEPPDSLPQLPLTDRPPPTPRPLVPVVAKAAEVEIKEK